MRINSSRLENSGSVSGRIIELDKGYVDRTLVGRYLGDITEVLLGSSVGGTDGFIGVE